MLVHARVDPVLARVMLQLGLQVPPYARLDGLVLSHALLPPMGAFTTEDTAARAAAAADGTWGFKLAVHSVHGQACMMPMVRAGGWAGGRACVWACSCVLVCMDVYLWVCLYMRQSRMLALSFLEALLLFALFIPLTVSYMNCARA